MHLKAFGSTFNALCLHTNKIQSKSMLGFDEKNHARRNRWFFGGTASAISAGIVHPLDLLKVHLQTQQHERHSITKLILNVYKNKGLKGFYNGLSASLFRQLTYNMARFGIYESGKNYIDEQNFAQTAVLAILAGTLAGLLGVPAEKINVRMQNDMKFPAEKRRNYRHIFDGLWRVRKEEGFRQLFAGGSFAVGRSIIVTISQNAMYDYIKAFLLSTALYKDNIYLHFSSSLTVAALSILVTQPLDVLKTRTMHAKPGTFQSKIDLFRYTAKLGPLAFFKGSLPAFIRLGPHYCLLFIIMEQMRLHFGYLPK